MPDKDVYTIKDLIYYQYAKIVAKNELNLPDREDAKQRHQGFIKSIYRGFIYGNKTWPDITREEELHVENNDKCLYCGFSNGGVQLEHLVPKSIFIKPECATCEKIHSIRNQVLSCSKCNKVKGNLGLYEHFKKMHSDTYFFYDFIPRSMEKKYLKIIYYCHVCAGTLEKEDIDGDGKLTVLDIDYILH